jgi:hypothetical protein
LRTGGILCVDEVESSLHPMLAGALLRLFCSKETNAKGAQVIFGAAAHTQALRRQESMSWRDLRSLLNRVVPSASSHAVSHVTEAHPSTHRRTPLCPRRIDKNTSANSSGARRSDPRRSAHSALIRIARLCSAAAMSASHLSAERRRSPVLLQSRRRCGVRTATGCGSEWLGTYGGTGS